MIFKLKNILLGLSSSAILGLSAVTVVACSSDSNNPNEKPDERPSIKNPIADIKGIKDVIASIKSENKEAQETKYYTYYSSYLELKWHHYHFELKDTIVKVLASDNNSKKDPNLSDANFFRAAIFDERFLELVKEDEDNYQLPHEKIEVISDYSTKRDPGKVRFEWEIGIRDKTSIVVEEEDIKFEIISEE